ERVDEAVHERRRLCHGGGEVRDEADILLQSLERRLGLLGGGFDRVNGVFVHGALLCVDPCTIGFAARRLSSARDKRMNVVPRVGTPPCHEKRRSRCSRNGCGARSGARGRRRRGVLGRRWWRWRRRRWRWRRRRWRWWRWARADLDQWADRLRA